MRNPDGAGGVELAGLDGVEVSALDVTSPEQIQATAAKAIETFGTIDVVFNNAGYGLAGPHEAFSDAQLERQLSTNLLGVMRTTREFLPHFRNKSAGLFITTTSIGGLITLPFNSVYHATKWALEGWSESLWYEVSRWHQNRFRRALARIGSAPRLPSKFGSGALRLYGSEPS